MTTTSFTFGSGDTLLGLDYDPPSAHGTATRANFQALPTVSFATSGAATSYTVIASVGKTSAFGATPHAVLYLTTVAGGTATSGGASAGVGSYASGVFVTFTTTSSTALVDFLKGIYLGDTSAHSVSESFAFTLSLSDNLHPVSGTYANYYDVACYLRGTGIATDQGDVAVEDLRIGDLLRTVDGSLKPVKFIGTQSFEAEFIAATPSQRPVLIRKDAIGEGLPARDLYVSALHSIYIDDVLVPAVALVNGVSIVRADVPNGVEYFHVEMDAHEVILAEGLPAESFIDDDSRAVFDNAFEYETLYGEGARIMPVAPRMDEGYTVDTIRRRVAARAGVTFAASMAPVATVGHVERLESGVLGGWVMDQANSDAAVELEILVDGELVGRTIANRYRTDLDHAGLAGGRCGFTMALPAAAISLDQVQVRIAATGAELRKAATVAAAA